MYGERDGCVYLDHERYKIGAKINTIGGYSAHVDQKGLLGFVMGMRHWSSQVRIVYGEPRAKRELGERLKARYKQAESDLKLIIPSRCTDFLFSRVI